MAVSAGLAIGAGIVYTQYEANEEAKKARQAAEEAAKAQTAALLALKAQPVPVIPIADEEASKARRRSISDQLKRRGRASTILTNNAGPTDALGA